MKEPLEKNNWQFDCYVAEKMAEKIIDDTGFPLQKIHSRKKAFELWQNYTKHFMFDLVLDDIGTQTAPNIKEYVKQPIQLTEKHIWGGVKQPGHEAQKECLFDGWEKDKRLRFGNQYNFGKQLEIGIYEYTIRFMDDSCCYLTIGKKTGWREVQTPHDLSVLTGCPISDNGIKLITG